MWIDVCFSLRVMSSITTSHNNEVRFIHTFWHIFLMANKSKFQNFNCFLIWSIFVWQKNAYLHPLSIYFCFPNCVVWSYNVTINKVCVYIFLLYLQGKADGNKCALWVRWHLQNYMFSIGCFIQLHCGKVLFMGLLLLSLCCIGFKLVKFETDVEALWVEGK